MSGIIWMSKYYRSNTLSEKMKPYIFKKSVTESNLINNDTWVILIVDDEEDIHLMTQMALNEFTFAGRKLKFLHA